MQGFYRRDVELVVQSAGRTRLAVENLSKLEPTQESARALAIARTHLETAELFLKDMAANTVEKGQ